MAPFLGGMRGLTVFVQDVRNCSNKVRATDGAREGAAVKAKARRAGDGGEDLPSSTMSATRRRARGGRREGRGWIRCTRVRSNARVNR